MNRLPRLPQPVATSFKLLPFLCDIREEEQLAMTSIRHEASELCNIRCKDDIARAFKLQPFLCDIREEEQLAMTSICHEASELFNIRCKDDIIARAFKLLPFLCDIREEEQLAMTFNYLRHKSSIAPGSKKVNFMSLPLSSK